MASAKLAHRPEPMDPQCRHDPRQELAILAERMAELRARRILCGGNPDAPRPPFAPARPPVPPGALKRFLKRRG